MLVIEPWEGTGHLSYAFGIHALVDRASFVRSTSWSALPAGTELRIVKLAPDGHEVTSYPGEVLDAGAPLPWLVARADWILKPIALDGLTFVPGDLLHEFFSPEAWFNVFSVWSPDGDLRGWYANVTYPARLDTSTVPSTLYWQDLFIDVIALPNSTVTVRDEDELFEAGLATNDPALHATILTARDELLRRFAKRAFPFHEAGGPVLT